MGTIGYNSVGRLCNNMPINTKEMFGQRLFPIDLYVYYIYGLQLSWMLLQFFVSSDDY